MVVEAHGGKNNLEIRPFDPIVTLAYIQFEGCVTLFIFRVSQPVHALKTKNNIISNDSARDEGALVSVDHTIHNLFEPIHQRSGNNLVGDVA